MIAAATVDGLPDTARAARWKQLDNIAKTGPVRPRF
jgi:hypothetical protein